MAQHQILTGARAVVKVNGQVVGVFSRVNYTVGYDAVPAYILGRYSAAEITYTAAEVVSVDAAGFRIIGKGPHAHMSVPKLQELLNHDSITLEIYDRRPASGGSNVTFLKIEHVRPVGFSTNISARGQVEVSVRFLGTIASDEAGSHAESAGAVILGGGTT